MDKVDVVDRLRAHAADLRLLGVEHLFLFGSTARDEAESGSDVDLFFDYRRGAFGLYELMDLREFVGDVLACEADVISRDGLYPALRAAIEADALQIF